VRREGCRIRARVSRKGQDRTWTRGRPLLISVSYGFYLGLGGAWGRRGRTSLIVPSQELEAKVSLVTRFHETA